MVGTFDLDDDSSKIIGFPKKFVYSVLAGTAGIGIFVAYVEFNRPNYTSTKFIDDLNNDSIKEKVITYSPKRKDTLYSKLVYDFQSRVVDTTYVKDSYLDSNLDSNAVNVPELTPLILRPEVKSLAFDYDYVVPTSSNLKSSDLNSLDNILLQPSHTRKLFVDEFVLDDLELK